MLATLASPSTQQHTCSLALPLYLCPLLSTTLQTFILMSITFYHFADELRCSLSDSAAAVSNDDRRPTVVLLGLPGVVADAACIFLPVQLNVLHERQPTAVLLGLPGVVADDACMCLSVQLGTSHLSFKLKPS